MVENITKRKEENGKTGGLIFCCYHNPNTDAHTGLQADTRILLDQQLVSFLKSGLITHLLESAK